MTLVTTPGAAPADVGLTLREVTAGRLRAVSGQLGRGFYTLCASRERGTLELVELLAGVRRPQRGTLTIAGLAPDCAPALRARLGALLARETLPEYGTVEAHLQAMLQARGDGRPPLSILSVLGLEAWAERQTRHLDEREARTLSLALALTTPEPLLIVLDEPLAQLCPLPGVVLGTRLLELGRATCVLAITSSQADARRLGGLPLLLSERQLAPERREPVSNPALTAAIVLRVRTPQAPQLLEALTQANSRLPTAGDPTLAPETGTALSAISWDAQHAPGEVIVRGYPAKAVALHVAQLLHAHAIPVEDLTSTLSEVA